MNFLKKNKLILFISFTLIIVLWFGFEYVYRTPISIENMEVSYSGKASSFLNLIKKTPLGWENRPVEITGIITELDGNNFIIDNFIFCQLKSPNTLKSLPKTNSQVTIKGIIIGYDELLNELKINQCIIKN